MEATILVFVIVVVFLGLLWVRERRLPTVLCTTCESTGRARRHTPGSLAVEIALWCCFVVPGWIYTIWRMSHKRLACRACGAVTVIPADSPAARRRQAAEPVK